MPTTTPQPGQVETKAPEQPQRTRSPDQAVTDLTETLIVEPIGGEAIRPFQYRASDEELAELKRRIAATRSGYPGVGRSGGRGATREASSRSSRSSQMDSSAVGIGHSRRR